MTSTQWHRLDERALFTVGRMSLHVRGVGRLSGRLVCHDLRDEIYGGAMRAARAAYLTRRLDLRPTSPMVPPLGVCPVQQAVELRGDVPWTVDAWSVELPWDASSGEGGVRMRFALFFSFHPWWSAPLLARLRTVRKHGCCRWISMPKTPMPKMFSCYRVSYDLHDDPHFRSNDFT